MRVFRFLGNIVSSFCAAFPRIWTASLFFAIFLIAIVAFLLLVGFVAASFIPSMEYTVRNLFVAGSGVLHIVFISAVFGIIFWTLGKDIATYVKNVWRNS